MPVVVPALGQGTASDDRVDDSPLREAAAGQRALFTEDFARWRFLGPCLRPCHAGDKPLVALAEPGLLGRGKRRQRRPAQRLRLADTSGVAASGQAVAGTSPAGMGPASSSGSCRRRRSRHRPPRRLVLQPAPRHPNPRPACPADGPTAQAGAEEQHDATPHQAEGHRRVWTTEALAAAGLRSGSWPRFRRLPRSGSQHRRDHDHDAARPRHCRPCPRADRCHGFSDTVTTSRACCTAPL